MFLTVWNDIFKPKVWNLQNCLTQITKLRFWHKNFNIDNRKNVNFVLYESTNLRIYESTNEHKQTTKDRFQTWTTVNIFFWSIQQKYNFSKDNFSNVKTGEPIVPKFCVGPHVAPEKVYNWSKFQIFASIKIRFLLNFWKFLTFFVCFTIYTKRICSQLK